MTDQDKRVRAEAAAYILVVFAGPAAGAAARDRFDALVREAFA